MKINLLPDELLAVTGTKKIAEDLKKIVMSVFGVFIVGVAGAGAYLVVLNFQLKNLETEQSQLKTSAEVLETAEQQIVLVKDRIQKTKQVLGSTKTEEAVGGFNDTILSFLPADVRVTEAKVSQESTTASFIVLSSSSLSDLFANMSNSEKFSKIRMESLSFSPTLGYLVSVEMFYK